MSYNSSSIKHIFVNDAFTPDRIFIDSNHPLYQKYAKLNISNTTEITSILCGFLTFCNQTVQVLEPNVALSENSFCSLATANVLITCYVLLGITILLLNTLVISNFVGLKTKVKSDIAKFSMAVADSLTGILILIVVPYNFSWTIQSTPKEINSKQLSLRGSSVAIVGGMFYMLTFTSSLYHLAFLGLQRLYAIKWPIAYKIQSNRTVYIGLATVWGLSLLASSIPVWFPDDLVFTYYVTIFIYFVSLKKYIPGITSALPSYLLLTTLILIPFAIMLATSLTSGWFVHKHLARRKNMTNSSHPKSNQKEINAYKTIATMQGSFTLTMLPLFVVTSLFYAGVLNCDNPIPVVTSTFISMSNRLLNPIIYCFRDKTFRNSIARIIKRKSAITENSLNQPPTLTTQI